MILNNRVNSIVSIVIKRIKVRLDHSSSRVNQLFYAVLKMELNLRFSKVTIGGNSNRMPSRRFNGALEN